MNNNNFRLNEANKKNIEKLIGMNSKNIDKINYNEKSKSKSKNKKPNKITKNNNSNNIHVFSTINDYWAIREKKNKERMNKIKKEREKKIYGNVYPIPKINKNTQEIIEKIKERTYNISLDDQVEDQINNKIPIKSKLNNYFTNNFIYKGKNKKSNKSTSKIKINKSYDNLMKIRNNQKRSKTSNPKKLKNKKIKKKFNKEKVSMADVKNYELIMQLRKNEEIKKIKELEKKMKLENDFIEEQIDEEEDNSPDKTKNREKYYNLNIDQKVENYLNKSMNLISFRSKSSNPKQNINELITSRMYLNDFYNKDKKIINHSYVQSSSYSTIPKNSNQKNIELFYKSKPKLKKQKIKSTPKLNKSFNTIYSLSQNNLNISLYDPKTKSLRYRHYTEGGSYSYNYINNNINDNINDNINNNINKAFNNKNNNSFSNNIKSIDNIINNNIFNNNIKNIDNNNNNFNNIDNNNNNNISLNYVNKSYEQDNSPDKINKNVIYFNPPKQQIKDNNNQIRNHINEINNFKREIKEKGNEINNFKMETKEKDNEKKSLCNKEYNYKSEEINKIQNELEQNSILNQELLNEAKNLKDNNCNEYKNIILKNESINNMYNELDKESLLRYREENNQRLNELNQKNYNKKNNLNLYLKNQIEESKNINNQIDKDIYRKITSQKFKNIIKGEQQQIENNLDYYNKELQINAKKKELLLNKMFGDEYTRKAKKINNDKININFKNNDMNNYYGIEKYLVKNNAFKIISNFENNEINKYKFVYSPYKMVNGIKKEVKKEDFFNEDEQDIVGSFNFHRKHHFA
jgi:hypothetical protein